MRRKWLTWSILMLGCLVLSIQIPANALAKDAEGAYESKDEVVYGNLDHHGDTRNMYIVNSFDVKEEGKIDDYGDYETVKNLTDLSDIKQSDKKVTFDAEEDQFYYQGTIENQPLPWDIDIEYKLDGKKIEPEKLAGKSGHLDIEISTKQNKKVDDTFFDYYLLQISITLDPQKFTQTQAPKATQANEGKDESYSFSVMPESEEELVLSTEAEEIEIDPIDISAVPANMSMDDPDTSEMTDGMEELSDGVHELYNGIAELKNGIEEWQTGAEELQNGSAEFNNGLQELDNSSGELEDGSGEILDALEEVDDELDNVPDMDELDELDEVEELPDTLRDVSGDISHFSDKVEEFESKADEDIEDIEEAFDEDEFQEIIDQLEDNEEVDEETIEQIENFQANFEEWEDSIDEEIDFPEDGKSILQDTESGLNNLAEEIEGGLDKLDDLQQLEELQQGISEMASQYDEFHQGLLEYTSGVHELAENYQEIDEGIQGLVEGASGLEDGASELEEGAKELDDETASLPGDMQSEIDDMLDEFDFSDFDPISFVSDKNKDVDVVQFVLQTEKIEVPEPEEPEEEEEEKSIWQRFLELFK